MKVDRISIETIKYSDITRENVVVLWTEDGQPHTLPDIDQNVSYPTQLARNEKFEIITVDHPSEEKR